jgi:hypothetical protein
MNDASNSKTKPKSSTLIGALALLVLVGVAATFGVQACAESTPTTPAVPGASGSTSSSATPPAVPPPVLPVT